MPRCLGRDEDKERLNFEAVTEVVVVADLLILTAQLHEIEARVRIEGDM